MAAKILIIDDELVLPLLIRDYLEDVTDFQIMIASSGEKGLEMCNELPPDLCIVDMRLPDMTGNEFIQAAHTKMPECKYIIHTGSLDYLIPDELQQIGISQKSILFKPVLNLTDFSDKINDTLHL